MPGYFLVWTSAYSSYPCVCFSVVACFLFCRSFIWYPVCWWWRGNNLQLTSLVAVSCVRECRLVWL